MRRITTGVGVTLCLAVSMSAAAATQQPVIRQSQTIEVTATKIAEDVMVVPQSVTVIDGDEIRARGANDLSSALALVAGLSMFPGGDAGPAAGVPEMWGVREADAFLLVVDGVPWGGAFNPDLPSVSLADVDRIEVVRGPAPVMYGATSFTGVIHVVRRAPDSPGQARLAAGSRSSAAASVTLPLTRGSATRNSLTADYERRVLSGDDAGFDRIHALFRSVTETAGGTLHFDVDALRLLQSPGSPHPRAGRVLSPDVPLDANHNPSGAKLDQDGIRLITRYEKTLPLPWSTTLSLGRTESDILRGFLEEEPGQSWNAAGFGQQRSVTDVYFDSHVALDAARGVRIVAGVDHLHGRGSAGSRLFEYFVPLAGHADPADAAAPGEETSIEDRRDFTGVYVQSEWTPLPRLRIDAGARLNRVAERRRTGEDETESVTLSRGSGGVGALWQLTDTPLARLALFANYRNTFKPAAFDFSPHAEPEILRPETGKSWQAGVRGRLGDGAGFELSGFRNDLENLLVSTVVDGAPALVNGGRVRVDGAELELHGDLAAGLRGDLAWAYHDARYRDYVQAFGGVPTQLSGRRFEMSPLHLISAGVLWDNGHAPTVHAEARHTGARYLTKRNTAVAEAFTVWSAGVGFRLAHGQLRIDGHNLTNRRDPVAESELGEAQYYRMPARDLEVSYEMTF